MELEHVTDAMNLSDQRRFARGNPETRPQSPRAQRILQRLHQIVHAFASPCRDCYTSRKSFGVSLGQFAIRQVVDLVENDHRLLSERVEFLDHALEDRKSTRLNSSH